MTHGVGFWCYRVVLAGGLKEGFVCSQQPKVEDKRALPMPDIDVAAGADAPKILDVSTAEAKWPASILAQAAVTPTSLPSIAPSSTTAH